MRDEDHSYSGVQLAAWNVFEEKLHQGYFPVTYLTFTHNFYPTPGTAAISCLLSYHV